MYIEIYMNEYRSETKQTWEILHINWWSPDFFHSECELSSYCIGGGWLSNRMPVHGRIRTVARAHPPKEPVHHSWLTVSFCKGDHVSISQTIHAHKNLPWRNIFSWMVLEIVISHFFQWKKAMICVIQFKVCHAQFMDVLLGGLGVWVPAMSFVP